MAFISCGKHDESDIPGTATKPQNQIFLSNLETFYGSNVPIREDPVSFKVDSLNRISEISYYVTTHTVSYPDSNLITCHSNGTVSNSYIDQTTDIYLKNNKVKKICKNQVQKYPDHTTRFMESDSIIFTYNSDNHLTQIDFFAKLLESSLYFLDKVYEYTYENGNVTKLSKTRYGDETTLNYSYDNLPNIDYGEYAPDMPFRFDYYYPLIYNKLGKRNINNIIKATYTYTDPTSTLGLYHFDYINYERDVNSYGLLIAIKTSGHMTSNDLKTTMTYNDGKISFTYR